MILLIGYFKWPLTQLFLHPLIGSIKTPRGNPFAYTLGKKSNDITQTDVTDPRGNVKRVVFNAAHLATSVTHISGTTQLQTQYQRQTGTNFVSQITDPLGRRTVFTYDTCGNRTGVTRASGTALAATTTLAYQTGSGTYPCIATLNRVTSVTDPLNRVTSLGYDTKGNLTSVANPAPFTSEISYTTYDLAGNPLTQTDPTNRTVTFGWQNGQLVSTTDPLNRRVEQVADNAGRVTSVTNPLGFTTIYDFDPANRLKRVLDPLQGATSFTWDANSNLKTLTDARGGVTGYDYNNRDQLFTRTDPLTRADSSLYDLNGN